jgi:acyl dehydratase
LAPPCILYAIDATIVAPKLPGVQWIYAGTNWTWLDHIRVDDSFRVEAVLTDQEVKSGRRFARWVLQTGQVRYFNQRDELAATATAKCARTPRGGASSSDARQPGKSYRYDPDELADIERLVLAEARQGGSPLYWEDIGVGDAVPAIIRGPLTITDIIAWYAATQGALHYGGAHGDALRYRQRHEDYHINTKTGAKDAAGRGHLDPETGRDVGMGGAYDVGPQRISWAQTMLNNWIGDHGFLHKLNVSVRQPNMVGDTLWWSGEVTAKRQTGSAKVADIKLEARNQSDVMSAFGNAVVALPSRANGPVPLPLQPGN